jgi:arsenate reductase (glutaredoxin)
MEKGELTVYENPACTTCRKLVEILREEGVPFERVNYMIDPLPLGTLKTLLRKGGLQPRDVVRTKDAREAGIDTDGLSDAELLQLLVEHPGLLQRPLVERGDRVVLARPPEKVRALF